MKTARPILGIDCALGGLSVSLVLNGGEIGGFADPALNEQAARLLPVVEETMRNAAIGYGDLSGIAVTVGPGGFTGVRIGLAAARGLAFATGLPLFGATTLSILAEGRELPVLAALPAGREAFYVQSFPDFAPPEMIPATALSAAASAGSIVTIDGPWLALLPSEATPVIHDTRRNAFLAAMIAERDGFDPAAEAVPLYIRPPDAKPQTPLIDLATSACRVD